MMALFAPWPALAKCAAQFSFCQRPLTQADPTLAVFVGKVKSVTMLAVKPPDAPSEARTPEVLYLSGRNLIRIPMEGENGVRTSERQYPFAKLDVTESFTGGISSEFTVHLTSDAFMEGIPLGVLPFREGESWLVEAYYDAHLQKWMTSICQRTKLLSQASDDLQSLRAWIAGNSLSRRIQGQVVNPNKGQNTSDVAIVLRGPSQTLFTTTDHRGQFFFDGLEPGTYEATMDGAQPRKVNLDHAWCSYVVLLIK
jgi:hypothetical protein